MCDQLWPCDNASYAWYKAGRGHCADSGSEHAYGQLAAAEVLFASNSFCVLTQWSADGPFRG